ncbi:MAG: hypothetical protein QOI24_3474 [Acidobacteriota bacterium]|nr:hypothetical protein [Acidobacteriota bacterium]
MKISLRSQFWFLIIPFIGALIALLISTLAPYLAIHRNILDVEHELAYTLAMRAFADSFTEQTREYADYVVTGDAVEVQESDSALAASRRDLVAWRQLAARDGGQNFDLVRQVTADHKRVTKLGTKIIDLRRAGQRDAAAAALVDELLPQIRNVSRTLDQNVLEHQQSIFRHVSMISGAISSSTILQFGGMLKRIDSLNSDLREVLESVTYKRAIEEEVQRYWYFFLSGGRIGNDIDADHERVNHAFAIWRLSVKGFVDEHTSTNPKVVEELQMADEIQRGYLALHAIGEKSIQLTAHGAPQRAQSLLQHELEFENTAISKTMEEYTANEIAIAGKNLERLEREAARSRIMLLAGGLLILLIALGVPWFLSRRMIDPILDLQRAALRIGRGDLETTIAMPSTIELASLATTFNDMTRELKVARNKDLEKSEERFRLAARATMDMIWDWDPRTDQVWVDERFRENFGSGGSHLSAAQFNEVIHVDDWPRVELGFQTAAAGTEPSWADEFRLRRPDGSWAQMISRGYIVREPDGEALRMIGAMTDVTERRNAEQAMASLHRQKEMILNSVGDGIFGLDAIGNIVSVNPAGIAMLGCEESDLLGKPVTSVVHCVDAQEIPLIFTTLRDGTLQSSAEELFRRADDSSFPIDYVSNPMCDDDGNVVGAVVTFRDITERHEIERLKSQFVATVSHELRTPLTSIRGALGLLSGGLLGSVSPKGQRMLEIAVSNTDRLVRLINDILDVERIDSQPMKMAGAVVDAFDLMKRAAESVQSIADVAGVRVVVEPATVSIAGDADRIIQTLTNLVGNAIKFSPRDTTVTVSAGASGDKCTFRVADEGRGLPADKLEMIFERFQQVDASDSRDKGGSGLGLAICRSIVIAHGGRIWAEKNEPAGSVFQFTIPLAIAQAPGVEANGRTLLVCQESDSAMPGIVRMLEGEGFQVLRCFESEVTARVAETRPDAVVLDLASNGGHGWQVVEALKSDPETRDVPIVVATMQSPESWEHYAAAVASWVRQPFGCRDLLDAVTEACSGPSILVVEDDPDLAKVLTAILQRHGIRTLHAANGRDAVELCRQCEPSLIVLDLILPDIDGFAVVKALRESAALRRIPLLVYSGLDVDAADQARLRLGPTEFLIKSQASLAEFESRVVRLLDTMTTNAEAANAA